MSTPLIMRTDDPRYFAPPEVRELFVDNAFLTVTGKGTSTDGLIKGKGYEDLVRACIICSDAKQEFEGGFTYVGPAPDVALMVLGEKANFDIPAVKRHHKRVEIKEDDAQRWCTVVPEGGKKSLTYWRLSPETALRQAKKLLVYGTPVMLPSLETPLRLLRKKGLHVEAFGCDETLYGLVGYLIPFCGNPSYLPDARVVTDMEYDEAVGMGRALTIVNLPGQVVADAHLLAPDALRVSDARVFCCPTIEEMDKLCTLFADFSS